MYVPFMKGCSTNLCNQVINNAILSVARMEWKEWRRNS